MGSMAPYFSVYPTPAKVPTNAAVLASQHDVWTVTVLDGETPVEVRVERFGGALAIRPVRGWPPGRSLEIVATLSGMEKRHPFETAASPHAAPPSCAWKGPSTIHPKSATPQPDTWPTNIPRPPKNQRTFSLPQIDSPAGYMVMAQLRVKDRGKTSSMEVGLFVGQAIDANLVPPTQDEFTDKAQVIGMTLTDVAGNVARYGTTD